MTTTRGRRRWPALGTVLALTVLSVSFGVPPAAATGGDAVVDTAAGPVRGTVHDEYRMFQGLPFAAPPVGELRWRPPQPVEPWSQVRDATRPGNRCAQNPDPSFGFAGSEAEDCLYLNVTAPASATPEDPRPVMVWLHGGGSCPGLAATTTPAGSRSMVTWWS